MVAPVASLVDFARDNGIALSGIALGEKDAQPRLGNRITMLVTLSQGSSKEQWLAIVTQDALTAEEMQAKPLPEEALYTSTGREMRFKNTRTALSVQFVGPFAEKGGAAAEKLNAQLRGPHRALVCNEQLNFGMDRYGRTAMSLAGRCNAAGVKMRELYHIGDSHPLSKDQLEKGKRFVNLIQPTEDEERTIFSVSFALNAFLSAALDIDEFSDLVDCVLNKPSVWGVLSHFGVRRFLNYDVSTVHSVDASYLGVNMPAYRMPLRLRLNDEVALAAVITMTAATPPLQTCAGIIEVYAEHPVDPGKRLLIQLIAGRQ